MSSNIGIFFFLSAEPYVSEALTSFIIEHTLLTERRIEVLEDVGFRSFDHAGRQLLLVLEHLVLPRQVLKGTPFETSQSSKGHGHVDRLFLCSSVILWIGS
jgi:hypothetical protein